MIPDISRIEHMIDACEKIMPTTFLAASAGDTDLDS